MPFEPGEVFGPGPADDLLAFLAESGHVRQAGDGRWYWSSENFPASEISMRTAAPENVVIIDTSPDRPRVLGEVDLFSAQVLVHDHAIYIHESVQYHVDKLDWGERKAYVHKIDADHYTYANRAVTLKPLDVFADAPATSGRRIHGEVMVASLVTLYKKLKFVTDENVGWGPVDLPEIELQTTAYWLTADALPTRWSRNELDVALIGAGRAIQTIAAVLLMVDPRDLGLVAQVRSPHQDSPTIYLYEAVPGGIGMSERLWQRHEELVAGAADLIRGLRLRRGLPGLHGSAPRTRHRRQGARAPVPPRSRRGRGGGRMSSVTLERRLANYRAAARPDPAPTAADARRTTAQAMLLAEAVGGEVVGTALEAVVRCEPLTVVLPLDRDALARLPGQPPPDAPLVCLDTETTGLATAAGTMAFLVGLGWWEGDRFRQAQLILPDQPNEPALLALIEAHIPASAWLVTYNGRGFDWPLLVTRYRMARRDPPAHAGHLDLLPFVRRVFRHRMTDARLRTSRRSCSASSDTRTSRAGRSPAVTSTSSGSGSSSRSSRSSATTARTSARSPDCSSTSRRGSPPRARSSDADPGDLAGLARAYARERRLDEALACLDAAVTRRPARSPDVEDDWWLPSQPVDFGGRRRRPAATLVSPRVDSPWTEDRILVERARLLRRLGRFAEAALVWESIGAGAGPLSAHAWIEVAKLREHRLRDVPGAFAAAERARAVIVRRRRIGRFDPALDHALAGRLARLGRRLDARLG